MACTSPKDFARLMQSSALTIGTRGSPLALYQARLVQRLICETSGRGIDDVIIKILKTSGDTIKGELKDFGGKGLFTRELELALLDGSIDLAVHSMKDVPTVGHEDLVIRAILPRADVRDAFISAKYKSISDLPKGALFGSASLRRRAQLAAGCIQKMGPWDSKVATSLLRWNRHICRVESFSLP